MLLNAKGVQWNNADSPDDLRPNEKMFVIAERGLDDGNVVAILDLRKSVVLESILSIFQTVFVCIVLGTGAMVFQN